MKIEFTNEFIKNHKRRFRNKIQFQKKFETRVRLFSQNPKNPIIRDHELKGDLKGKRSFWITGDIRVVYMIYRNTAYFIDIGTHNQVYK